MKQIIFFFFLLYVLSLLQTSFFAHFGIKGVVPNLVLISVFLINYSISRKTSSDEESSSFCPENLGAFFGGFMLDIFSDHRFAISGLLFFSAAFLLQKAAGLFNRANPLFFLASFTAFILFYDFSLSLISFVLGAKNSLFPFSLPFILTEISFNLAFALLGYFVFAKSILKRRQPTLF